MKNEELYEFVLTELKLADFVPFLKKGTKEEEANFPQNVETFKGARGKPSKDAIAPEDSQYPREPLTKAALESDEGQAWIKKSVQSRFPKAKGAEKAGSPMVDPLGMEITPPEIRQPGAVRAALNMLAQKGITAKTIGAEIEKAAKELAKGARQGGSGFERKFKEQDLPIINKIKKELMSVLAGDLSEAKLTYKFFNILNEAAKNEIQV